MPETAPLSAELEEGRWKRLRKQGFKKPGPHPVGIGHNAGPDLAAFRDYAIELRPPDALKANPKNPRTHTKRKIRDLAAAIRAIGFMTPVIIDEQDMILAGQALVAAAKMLDLRSIPTIQAQGLSQEQRDAFVLASNKFAERAGWDREKLASYLQDLQVRLEPLELDLSVTGFEAAEIEVVLDDLSAETTGPDDVLPATSGRTVSRRGDLWLLGKHRLLCGDARSSGDIDHLMGGALADAVFADPPYNVRVAGHVQGRGRVKHKEFAFASGEMSDGEFRTFLSTCLSTAARVSRDGAIHFVCMDWRHVDALIEVGRVTYGAYLNLVVWNKTNAGQGSFYRSQHELIGVFRVGDGAHQNNVELGRHGRNRSNVWTYQGINTFGADRDKALAWHPTVKPVALVADALRDCTAKGDLVLDPFLGSGSTLIAAEKVGRRCFGLEYEPAFVDVAIRRWQVYTHRDAIVDGDGRTFDEITAERVAVSDAGPPGEPPSPVQAVLDSQAISWIALCEPMASISNPEAKP